MYSYTVPLTSALVGGGLFVATPRPLYFRESHGTHCTGGWVGQRGQCGRLRKISAPPRFDPRPVQPVASRCTDFAVPANELLCIVVCVFLYVFVCVFLYVFVCCVFYVCVLCVFYVFVCVFVFVFCKCLCVFFVSVCVCFCKCLCVCFVSVCVCVFVSVCVCFCKCLCVFCKCLCVFL